MSSYTPEYRERERAQYERELRQKEDKHWMAYRAGLVRYAAARNAEPRTKGEKSWR